MYFLTNRKNPTPYDYVLAGNGPDNYEKDIVDILKKEKPCLMVIDRIFTNYYPIASEWDRIERYIFSEYEIGFDSICYEVLLPAGTLDNASFGKGMEERIESTEAL